MKPFLKTSHFQLDVSGDMGPLDLWASRVNKQLRVFLFLMYITHWSFKCLRRRTYVGKKTKYRLTVLSSSSWEYRYSIKHVFIRREQQSTDPPIQNWAIPRHNYTQGASIRAIWSVIASFECWYPTIHILVWVRNCDRNPIYLFRITVLFMPHSALLQLRIRMSPLNLHQVYLLLEHSWFLLTVVTSVRTFMNTHTPPSMNKPCSLFVSRPDRKDLNLDLEEIMNA